MAKLSIPHTWRSQGIVFAGVASAMLVGTTIVTLTGQPSIPTSPRQDPGAVTRSGSDLPVDHPVMGSTVGASFHARIEQLKRQLADQPHSQDLLLEIASQLRDGHKTEEAIPYYTRYLEENNANQQPWLDLAACYADLEDWDAAESTMRSMLTVHPGHIEARYNLGAILANKGDVAGAKAIWQQLAEETAANAVTEQARLSLARLQRIAS